MLKPVHPCSVSTFSDLHPILMVSWLHYRLLFLPWHPSTDSSVGLRNIKIYQYKISRYVSSSSSLKYIWCYNLNLRTYYRLSRTGNGTASQDVNLDNLFKYKYYYNYGCNRGTTGSLYQYVINILNHYYPEYCDTILSVTNLYTYFLFFLFWNIYCNRTSTGMVATCTEIILHKVVNKWLQRRKNEPGNSR